MATRLRPTQEFFSLKNDLINAKSLFVDSKFPPKIISLFNNGRIPPGSKIGQIVWKRPRDISSNPEFIIEGANHHDLDQGALGDCWFIAGPAVLAATHPAEFAIVVPPDQGFTPDIYTGMFRFNFWWYGKWVEVIIDDFLPTDGSRLIYCRNIERQDEFWPCLLEKAYAKLRGSYENLDGGCQQDAMVDLTGGISEVIDIRQKSEISPELYTLLYKSFHMKSMMGACLFKPWNSPPNEIGKINGLVYNHAYSITGFKQISTGRGTVNLLRLRNPWGHHEWNGPWSDSSSEMRHLTKELQNDLLFVSRNDGEFWMSYEDFIDNFEQIQLCHLQIDAIIEELNDNNEKQHWNVTVYHDAWLKGITAGGSGYHPYENLYWKNPQFYVTLSKVDSTLGHGNDCTLIVSLMVKEKNKSEIGIGFNVYELKSTKLRPLDNSLAPSNSLLFTPLPGDYVYRREVTKRFELKPGTYVIIPNMQQPYEESEFLLRLFTEKPIDTGVLDEVTCSPVKPVTKKGKVMKAFERHAGRDQKMDPSELAKFLEDVSSTELHEPIKLPLESCRSLMASVNEDKSGYLTVDKAKQAWKEIKAYREVFKQFDKDNSNTVETYELGSMLSKLGFPINRAVLTSIVRRYGGRESTITLSDFVMIKCKLTSLFASFHEQQRKKNVKGESVEFLRNAFLEATMFS